MRDHLFYHPRANHGAGVEERTVGRDALLRDLLEALQGVAMIKAKESHQPWLIRGFRGVGKTHILGVLAQRVENDPILSKALRVIWLPETEMYAIYSVGSLLRSILEEIKRSLSRQRNELAEILQNRLAESLSQKDHQESPDFIDFFRRTIRFLSEKTGNIFVILLENLDLIFDDFSPRSRNEEESALRVILQDSGEMVWICTTPLMRSPTFDHKKPLYGLFYERRLHPFSTEESWQLWEHARQEKARREKLYLPKRDAFEQPIQRHALHRLTGGRARNILMLAEEMPISEELEALRDAFFRVLDIQSTFFEQELNAVSPRERAVLACLAMSEKNLEAHEIASATGLPTRPLSTQLNRLVESGHLERYDLSKEKRTFFALSDGLFRYWYRFRQTDRVTELWHHFMAAWYPLAPLEAQSQLWHDMRQNLPNILQNEPNIPEEEQSLAKDLVSFFQKNKLFFCKQTEFLEEHASRFKRASDEGGSLVQRTLESILQKKTTQPFYSYTTFLPQSEQSLFRMESLFIEKKYHDVIALTQQEQYGKEAPIFVQSFAKTWQALALFAVGDTQQAFLHATQALEHALQTNDEPLQQYIFEQLSWLRPCVYMFRFSWKKAEREVRFLSKYLGQEQKKQTQNQKEYICMAFFSLGIQLIASFFNLLLSKEMPYEKELETYQWIVFLFETAESMENIEDQSSVVSWLLFAFLLEGALFSSLREEHKKNIQKHLQEKPLPVDIWQSWLHTNRLAILEQIETRTFEDGWFRGCVESCPVQEPLFRGNPHLVNYVENIIMFSKSHKQMDNKSEKIYNLMQFIFPLFESSLGKNLPPLLSTYRDFRFEGQNNPRPFLWEVYRSMSNRYKAFLALLLLREAWPSLPVNSLTEDIGWLRVGVENKDIPLHEETTRILNVYFQVAEIEKRYEAGLSVQAEEEMWMRWPKEERETLRLLVGELRKERKARQEEKRT